MELQVKRYYEHARYTAGYLQEQNLLAYVLEDPVREEKIAGDTCIPPGKYVIDIRREGQVYKKYDRRFQHIGHSGMLWLRDVPNFKWVYIHCGNKTKDTEGCLLVGESMDTKGVLRHSADAYERVYKMITDAIKRGERVTIEIIPEVV